MARLKLSIKHIQADKANKLVIVSTAIAVAVCVFGFFIMRGLVLRRNHQAKVITAKETAVKQLKSNLDSTKQIVDAYKVFTGSSINILGGNADPAATGEKDGDNARLILDALPSKYDFPALATSLEKILLDNNYQIDSITGTDDEVAQSAVLSQATPQPVEMPFGFSVRSAYPGVEQLVSLLERSIRPFKFDSIELTGTDVDILLTIKAKTYYQPEKALSVTKKVVK